MTTNRNAIRKGMNVIGADGVHIGVVNHVDTAGDRLQLARKDFPDGKFHYVPMAVVADIEGDNIRLSSTVANTRYLED